jgi:flagellar biosynthesis/type III secretory pathway chaperone
VSSEPIIQQASQQAGALAALLEQEFAALRAQDMDAFEALQGDKEAVLNALNDLAKVHGEAWRGDLAWAEFSAQMQRCHDAHRRNETILRRQLDVVRMALSALTNGGEPELYDHLAPGGTRAQRAARAYGE